MFEAVFKLRLNVCEPVKAIDWFMDKVGVPAPESVFENALEPDPMGPIDWLKVELIDSTLEDSVDAIFAPVLRGVDTGDILVNNVPEGALDVAIFEDTVKSVVPKAVVEYEVPNKV